MEKSPLAVRCPVCSASNFRIKYAGLKGVDGKKYDIIVCATCDFCTVSPMPSDDEIAKFYANACSNRQKINIYAHIKKEDFLETNKSNIEDSLTLLSAAEPYRTRDQTSLLDVGCGHGFMCYAAKLRGFDATGVDWDADAKRVAEAHLGVKIICGVINDVPKHDFDIITEIMTLEHVRQPREHVTEIRNRLKDGGLYVGSVPNVGGYYALIRGRKWYHFIPPEHVNYFSAKTLTKFLESLEFEVLHCGTIPLYAAHTIFFGVRSRLNELIAKQGDTLFKKSLITLYRVLTLTKRYIIYKPLNFLVLTCGLPGNSIFWVAKKKAAHAEAV